MLFNSIEFLVFFPVVTAVFFIIPKRARHIWLLIASYYFYMGWNAKYVILIFASTGITYFCAVFMQRIDQDDTKKRRAVLIAGLVLNLGLLVFFKYFYFLS